MENAFHLQQNRQLTDAPSKSSEMRAPALGINMNAGRWKTCCSIAAKSGWRLINIRKKPSNRTHFSKTSAGTSGWWKQRICCDPSSPTYRQQKQDTLESAWQSGVEILNSFSENVEIVLCDDDDEDDGDDGGEDGGEEGRSSFVLVAAQDNFPANCVRAVDNNAAVNALVQHPQTVYSADSDSGLLLTMTTKQSGTTSCTRSTMSTNSGSCYNDDVWPIDENSTDQSSSLLLEACGGPALFDDAAQLDWEDFALSAAIVDNNKIIDADKNHRGQVAMASSWDDDSTDGAESLCAQSNAARPRAHRHIQDRHHHQNQHGRKGKREAKKLGQPSRKCHRENPQANYVVCENHILFINQSVPV